MKTPRSISMFLAASTLAASSVFAQVTSDVVGYTTSSLAGGSGNIYAPAFVNSASATGSLTSATSGATSTLATDASLSENALNETTSVTGASKGYPRYYVEITNDTNSSDSLDTTGLIIDIVSNTASNVVVGANVSTLGLQGDESFVIREHVTLGSLFAGATGVPGYTNPITIYNEDGAGTAVTHLPDGVGGFVLNSDFVTVSTDAPIYPGTGIVINNPNAVGITATGSVKESPTQVVVYGGSVVNILSSMQPKSSVALGDELHSSLGAYADVVTPYSTDGTLSAQASFLTTGTGFVLNSDFVTATNPTVDGTSQAFVVNAASGTTVTLAGNSL